MTEVMNSWAGQLWLGCELIKDLFPHTNYINHYIAQAFEYVDSQELPQIHEDYSRSEDWKAMFDPICSKRLNGIKHYKVGFWKSMNWTSKSICLTNLILTPIFKNINEMREWAIMCSLTKKRFLMFPINNHYASMIESESVSDASVLHDLRKWNFATSKSSIAFLIAKSCSIILIWLYCLWSSNHFSSTFDSWHDSFTYQKSSCPNIW
jgi:hypothetical protein